MDENKVASMLGYNDEVPEQAKESGRLTYSIDVLSKETAGLNEIVSRLLDRLKPLRASSPEKASDGAAKMRGGLVERSPTVDSIDRISNMIAQENMRITQLLEELDI